MASDPTTWAELKTSLANWTSRSDLSTTEIPEAIALFEREAQRVVFTPDREITADLSASAEEVTLPADLWEIRSVYINTNPKVVLEPVPLSHLRDVYSASTTGKPSNYSLRGTKLILGPAPDTTYTIKFAYVQTIPALGASQATNWLLTAHPDLYVAGSLACLYKLLLNDPRAAFYAAERDRLIYQVNQSGKRRAHGGPRQRIRSPIIV